MKKLQQILFGISFFTLLLTYWNAIEAAWEWCCGWALVSWLLIYSGILIQWGMERKGRKWKD